ncbi:MAG: glycosyltransferase family 39 protein [Myxococcota bacterium]
MPRAILALALLIQIAVGLYGINQPVVWGHQGFHVAEHGLAARNLIRHGTWIPTRHSDPTPPPDSSLSYHHPFLLHPYLAATQSALGEAPWTARVIPLIFSLAAILGLFAFTRRVRGPTTAALAAITFALTPLNLVFAHLLDHQIIALAFVMASLCGLHAMLTRASVAGARVWLVFALLTGLTDWPWYPTAFLLFIGLALATLRGHLGPDRRRLAAFLAVFAAIVLFSFSQHFVGVWLHDGFGDLRHAFGNRGTADDPAEFLRVAIIRMRQLHTWPLVAALGVWVLLALWRTFIQRRFDLGTLAILSITFGQTIHLARFPTEFMVHEYRSYWYVLPAAFALADLAVTASTFAATRIRRPQLAAAIALVITAASLGPAIAYDRALIPKSRERAGSFLHPNYDARRDVLTCARLVNRLTSQADTTVAIGGGIAPRTEFYWLLDRRSVIFWRAGDVLSAERDGSRVWMVESTLALERNPAWQPLLRRSRVLIVGPYAVVELLPRGSLAGPSVESVVVTEPATYGALDRWLHAPARGPSMLTPTITRGGRHFITKVGLGETVLQAYERGERPLLAHLPAELVLPAAPAEAPAPAAEPDPDAAPELPTAPLWKVPPHPGASPRRVIPPGASP